VKRTISSSAQSAFKMLVLFFCVIITVSALASSFTVGRVRWGFVLPLAGALGFFLWFAMSRKTVQIDEHFLYVSVFRRVVQIPLDQIDTVTESIGMRDRAVTVHFRNETPFGRAITFTPTFMFGDESHPIVAELLGHIRKDEKGTAEQTGSS
jgi:hypothetical protein